MGYILDLRKIEGIGHRPLLMVTGAVFLFDLQDRVLLERRSDDQSWCVPGGSMELGETPEDAARREFYEETGLTLGALKLHSVLSGEDAHYVYPNGDEVYAVDFNYICREYWGALAPQAGEVSELAFFDVHALPDGLSRNDRRIILELSAAGNNE